MRVHEAIIITAGLCFLAACDEGEPSAVSKHGSQDATGSVSWPATRTTDRGGFDVILQPEGAEIKRNEHFSLDVDVVAKDGNAKGVRVAVDADMPAHQHGMNTMPEVTAQDSMRYRVDGMLFHMSGDWVINVDVSRGGKTERALFPVSVE